MTTLDVDPTQCARGGTGEGNTNRWQSMDNTTQAMPIVRVLSRNGVDRRAIKEDARQYWPTHSRPPPYRRHVHNAVHRNILKDTGRYK